MGFYAFYVVTEIKKIYKKFGDQQNLNGFFMNFWTEWNVVQPNNTLTASKLEGGIHILDRRYDF